MTTSTTETTTPAAGRGGRRGNPLRPPAFTWGFLAKLLFLAAVNGMALVGLVRWLDDGLGFGFGITLAATVALNVVYLSRAERMIPFKYLLPGTIFLVAFQVYPVLYNSYIAFTNFGTGNILTQEQAIDRIIADSLVPRADAPRYEFIALDGPDGEIAGYFVDPSGNEFLGTLDGLEPLEPDEVVREDDRVVEVAGLSTLSIRDAQDRQDELLEFVVPLDDGGIRVQTFTTAALLDSTRTYDPDADTFTDVTSGTVYRPVDGRFTADDGTSLNPGWRVVVGFDNFTRIVTSEAIRGPFFRVFVWNYVFAIGSVALTFAMGLALAMALNLEKMRSRKIYRSLLIIPYALPSFMSALIWRGLLNRDFGAINDILGISIPWLLDPNWAKVSVLLVNLWLGFPYMFLVSTGALQAVPDDIKEAALVDGATPRQAFRKVQFPLLMITLGPLLISSFAFNFNNFNVIYLLNGGGPPIAGAQTPAGHTDILISYTYRLAFEGGRGQDFGLAAAVSILIFVMVALVSAISFRRTRALENLN
ncbi:MAG TPA: ABC transporter permease subunit [Acidimicrobiales bacterium]|nr:ABC transporter permease subunit [Acidimicrobiales bacterium]